VTPRLAGAVAVVTGAGRGVGRAVAVELGRTGAAVAAWSRTREQVESCAAEIVAEGGEAAAWAVDVTERGAVERAAREVGSLLGPVTVLVNSAGTMSAVGQPWEVDPDEWWGDVQTSVLGSYLCARAFLPTMIEQGGGRIVNVASNVAVRPSPYQSGYAAGKAGVLSLTEALAAAGTEHGISVFAVSPGYVSTEMTKAMHRAAAGRPWAARLVAGEPFEPGLVAALVLRLAAGEADLLSGRYLHVEDDLDELLRRAADVVAEDAYVPRLRKLSP
jgi:NAD(P)-dependent dehydrogenase (short-subunit alcohol dehydrogenase family)